MTLNSSGPISLAGTTAGQSIEIENGGNGTTTISLNDTAVRTLAGVPSGAITMPTNFYGKSNSVNISYTYTSNTTNASLNVTSISGYVAGKSNITVTVNSGVYLWSNSTGTPGLTLTGGTTGDTVKLVNNGYIMGQGGNGGASGINGNAAGTALSIGYNISLTNNSYISGGGGGGAGGTGNNCRGIPGGGGGAGGGNGGTAVNVGGAGGAVGATGANASTAGCYLSTAGGKGGGAGGGGGGLDNNGSCSAGAGGGGGRILPGVSGAGGSGAYPGGNGGSSNSVGSNATLAGAGGGGWGTSGGSNSGRTGGAGGNAIALNGHTVTYVVTGNVWGAVS